jgi:ketosteroid isomerase-like protein
MSREAEQLIRDGYAALSRGDLDGWLAGVAEDAELHELPDIPDTAVYRGRDGFRKWAEAAIETVGAWEWEPEEFLLEDGAIHVVQVRLKAQGKGSGVPVDQSVFHVFRLQDGKVLEVRGFLDRKQAMEAASESD